MDERVQHLNQCGATEAVCSSYEAVPAGPSAAHGEGSSIPHPLRPRESSIVSPARSQLLLEESSCDIGGVPGTRGEGGRAEGARDFGGSVGGDGSRGVRGQSGAREGWRGMPGKRHIDFEVHLKNSQVKHDSETLSVAGRED